MITAAHCVRNKEKRNLDEIYVVGRDISTKVFKEGEEHYNTMDNKHEKRMEVWAEQILAHPQYDDGPEHNDLALIFLQNDNIFNSHYIILPTPRKRQDPQVPSVGVP